MSPTFLPRGERPATVRDRRNQQRGGLVVPAATAHIGVEGQREHLRVLLRVQHARTVATSSWMGTGGAILRLLRAAGVWKTFATEDQTFWCCTGTGIEEYAKPHRSPHCRSESTRRCSRRVEQHGSPLGPVNQTPPVPAIEVPTFRAAAADPGSWIEAADQPRTFRTVGQKKDVTLVPLNRLFDRRYSVYWHVS